MPAGPKLLHLFLLMYPTPTMIRFFNFTNHPLDKGRYSSTVVQEITHDS
jgi:hypothetical protein